MSENVNPEKKKGLLRFMELMDRDGPKFLKAGALVFLTLIPWAAALVMGVATGSVIWLLLCIPAGIIAAPQICGAADTVMRSMRDEIGWWWWDTYKTAWKRDLKASILPGAVFGFVIAAQVYSLYIIAGLSDPTKEFWMLIVAALVEIGVFTYFLPMLVCMEIPFPSLLRNCFVLFFSHPIKSLTAAIVQLVYYIIILMWFPLTSVIFMLTSVWFPMLVAYMILYPVLDKHFGLTEAYKKLRQEQWGEEM